ncbi:Gfo/Idh/MocA family protein [Luethyella okanaganae]|uniref:Gfo/Idh/MocA family protein n=1 Tax=Luethyella okanaganae TaxID=69372 RepID=A0ABW1VBI5_9MICO
MTDLRIGVVGFGNRGSLAREAHRPGSGSRVVAVYDPAERARKEASAAFPDAVVTATPVELLAAGIDAVMVLTPDHLHAAAAIPALEAGVAVFCEKPVAIALDDCDRILETARRTGSRLYVGHNMRHMPVITLMRELISDGRVGEVKAIWCRHFVGNGGDYYFKDWHADRSRSVGLLLQKGVHDLDIIHWLAGGYSTRVSGVGALAVYGAIDDRRDHSAERMDEWFSLNNWPPTATTGLNPIVDVEDISQVNLVLDNGVLGSYQQCHFTPDYWRNYTVIGTEGRLENLGDTPGSEIRLWNRRHGTAAPPDETYLVPAGEHGAAGGHGAADAQMITEFVAFAQDGAPTLTSPIAARQAVAAALQATASIRADGGLLPVPLLDPELITYFDAGQPA